MKKLLFAIVLIYSCKKEQPTPSSHPIQQSAGVNYVILNNDGHTNDTFYFYHNLKELQTTISGEDTSQSQRSFYLMADTLQLGTQHLSAQQNNFSNIGISTTMYYWFPEIDLTITRLDNSGGLIEGYYSGTMVRNGNNSSYVNFTGVFSVTRQ